MSDMKARIFAIASVLTVFSGVLPAVDSQLLNLVMPDAKMIGGVNVASAKASPFGQYVLAQIAANDQDMQKLATLTGFDPRRDVDELLFASNGGNGSHSGLAAATGTFNVASITTFATGNGAATETYGGVTILEDPKQTQGIAFLSGSLVAAGDIADVKNAIDRRSNPSILPAAVATQVKQLSAAEDAWGLTTVPLSYMGMNIANNASIPGLPANGLQSALGNIQSLAGGVKFGATVNFTGQAQADNEKDATALAGMIQFLANMAQLNAAKNPEAASVLQSFTASASGSTVTVSLSVPEDQFQQLLQPKANAARPHRGMKKQ